jgi:hypothetical protein
MFSLSLIGAKKSALTAVIRVNRRAEIAVPQAA